MYEVVVIPCRCGRHPMLFTRRRPPQALRDAAALVLRPDSTLRRAFERGMQGTIRALHVQFRRSVLGGTL
jgi:hypothetical protein